MFSGLISMCARHRVLVEVVQALCRDPNGDLANCIQRHAECMTMTIFIEVLHV